MSVEERAEARRRRALDLVEEFRVVERLGALGEVEITGAVRHDLVVAHDVDVDVTVDVLDRSACFTALGGIAADPRVTRVLYRNEEASHGWLFFEVVVDDWTIELYVSTPSADFFGWTAELGRVLAGALDAEQRHAILELKEVLAGDPEYRSMDVYRAVVDGGVRDLAAFRLWRAANGTSGLVRWCPGTVPPA